jgi:hypothetical protein
MDKIEWRTEHHALLGLVLSWRYAPAGKLGVHTFNIFYGSQVFKGYKIVGLLQEILKKRCTKFLNISKEMEWMK